MSTRMEVRIKKTVDATEEVKKALLQLRDTEVLVGVPEAKTDRTQGGIQSTSISNSMLAYIHNYGSPAQNIPARPFMEPGIAEGRDAIVAKMEMTAKMALLGRDVSAGLTQVGLTAQLAIQNKITSGPFQPLGERTLAARRRRGVRRTKPLIDTGQMRNSITYVIRKRRR